MTVTLTDRVIEHLRWFCEPPKPYEFDELVECEELTREQADEAIACFKKLRLEGYSQ